MVHLSIGRTIRSGALDKDKPMPRGAYGDAAQAVSQRPGEDESSTPDNDCDAGLPQQWNAAHEFDVRFSNTQYNGDQCPKKENDEQHIYAPRFCIVYRFIRARPTVDRNTENEYDDDINRN